MLYNSVNFYFVNCTKAPPSRECSCQVSSSPHGWFRIAGIEPALPVSHIPAFRGYHLFGNCHACVNLSVQDAFRAVRCIPNKVFVDWLLWLPSPFCAVATNKKEEVFTSLFIIFSADCSMNRSCHGTKFCDFSRYLCNLRCFDKFPVTPVNRSLFDCPARCAGGVYVISHS